MIAIAFGTINVVGGFLVTDRMLEMFKRRPEPKKDHGLVTLCAFSLQDPDFIRVCYIVAFSLFIIGLRLLNQPEHARAAATWSRRPGMAVAVARHAARRARGRLRADRARHRASAPPWACPRRAA